MDTLKPSLKKYKRMAVALFTAVLLFQLPALVRAQQPCTGPPPLSNTIASQNPVCPDQPFTLSLAGFTPQQGMTFEWRSSPDGQSFSPIQGGNGPILNQVQDGSTFYNCIVTCSQSGLSTPSIPVQVGMTQAIAQYPPQNVQLSATESTSPEHTGFVTYSSPCCTNSSVSYAETEEMDCCHKIITRTWTIVECGGSTYTYVQIITILLDEVPPVLTCLPLAAACNVVPTPSPTTVVVVDQCPVDLSVVTSIVPGTNPCEFIFIFVWTGVDQCGNTGTCTQTISVTNDTEVPTITCPAPKTLACNVVPTPSATTISASDNCGLPEVTLVSTSESGIVDCKKTYTFNWKATDACGNFALCSEVYIVPIDLVKPVIAGCPPIMAFLNEEGLCGAHVTWVAPTATDNCGIQSFGSNIPNGSFFPVGETTVVYTALDKCGNESKCSFVVSVIDVEPPNPHCPDLITVPNEVGFCGADVFWTIPATDNCGVLKIESDPVSGTYLTVGLHEITVIVTDVHGNTATCTFNVKVVDTEFPIIQNAPPSKIYKTDIGFCDAIITFKNVFATDNCGIESLVKTPAGNLFPIGNTVVRFTATDIYGNVTIHEFLVTVQDKEEPTIINCPNDIDVDNAVSQCRARVTWVEPTATDNCGIASFVRSHTPGAYFPVGNTTVTYTATDIHGNVSICTFDVDVDDTEKPRIIQHDIVTCDSIVFYAPLFLDNCGIDDANVVPPSGSIFPIGTTAVLAEAFDIHGNYKAIFFNVTRLGGPKQQDTLLSSRKNICLGDTVRLLVQGGTKGEGGYYEYFEVGAGGQTFLDTGNVITITPTDTGSHTYIGRILAVCDSTEFDTVRVHVKYCCTAPPVVAWTRIEGDRYPCKPIIAEFSVTPVAYANFVWTVPTGFVILSGQGSELISVSISETAQPGKICVKAVNDCGASDSLCLDIKFSLPKPTISPGTGTFSDPQLVSITAVDVLGGTIYYTISGNVPVLGTSFTKTYSGPFNVLKNTTVRAIVVKSCLPNSPVSVANLTISNPGVVEIPSIIPGTGSYDGPQLVAISTSTSGASVYYTLTGNTPTLGTGYTKLYAGPFYITATTTIKAIAIKTGLLNSPQVTAVLTISPLTTVASPVFSPLPGSFGGSVIITISSATPGAAIYMTTNGITPSNTSAASRLYTGPFTLSRSIVLKAIAYKAGMLPSAITVGTYSILPGRIAIENEDGAAFAPEKGISTLNVSVFPNPNPGIFRIQTKGVAEPASLHLINALGQVVWKAEANSTSSELEVNIQNLPNGVYTLVYTDATLRKQIRVTKQ